MTIFLLAPLITIAIMLGIAIIAGGFIGFFVWLYSLAKQWKKADYELN